jgi:hypothetical protein
MRQQAKNLGKPKAAINIANTILDDLQTSQDRVKVNISPTFSSGT